MITEVGGSPPQARGRSMILGMIRLCVMLLLMIGTISGQATQVPKVRIVFPKGHSEKASMTYGLHDPAQGYWNFFNASSVQPGRSFLEIPAETDRFKALVWAPGCQLKHLDVPVEKSDIELKFACDPLKTVPFHGRVVGIKSPGSWRVSVAYISIGILFWFYEPEGSLGSSAAPAIYEIATAPVSPQGTFKIKLPDLSGDPIASHDQFGHIEFRITDGKRVYGIGPRDAEGSGTGGWEIKIAPSYPNDVTFF